MAALKVSEATLGDVKKVLRVDYDFDDDGNGDGSDVDDRDTEYGDDTEGDNSHDGVQDANEPEAC